MAAGTVALSMVLVGCSGDDAEKAARADSLGCTEVPAGAAAAIESVLGAGVSLGEGSTGFERDGLWLVAAPLVDAEGVTQNAGFGVDLAADPVVVTAESAHALESSSAPSGSAPAAGDVLDCVFTTSW
ncbi:hypothetical protein ACFVQ3_13690 [Oerskovia sp. NPDC057915]|uniref:hypothetical protein n=1 Tax=Oerskovia sp. NPDC057915 TaxID=3346280 RepID=UPI0036DF9241